MTTLAPVLQAFFTERLMAQRRASSHTITGYRDTLRLLVGFACAKTGKTPSAMQETRQLSRAGMMAAGRRRWQAGQILLLSPSLPR